MSEEQSEQELAIRRQRDMLANGFMDYAKTLEVAGSSAGVIIASMSFALALATKDLEEESQDSVLKIITSVWNEASKQRENGEKAEELVKSVVNADE